MEKRERDIESNLRRSVEKMGGIAMKFTSPGNDGVPDRIIILQGEILFVELKTKAGRLSPVQVWQQERIRRAGAGVVTLYGAAGVEDFLHALRSRDDELLSEYGKR